MSVITRSPETGYRTYTWLEKVLLLCGVAYGVLYALTNDVLAAAVYGDYSVVDQAVSELSASGAPSRALLVALSPLYSLVLVAFGVGVLKAARGVRRLRATGVLLITFGATGPLWLPFPMSQREDLVNASASANDVGHIVLTALTVALIVASIVVASTTFGRGFRIYSWATVAVTLAFGGWTGVVSANLDQGDPTPWMGLLERVSMGAWFLWLAVFAVLLLRRPGVDR